MAIVMRQVKEEDHQSISETLMHRLSSTLLALAALCGAATSAFAGTGTVTTHVTPLSDAVTYSRIATTTAPALDTYVGYTVAVANAPSNTNTINNIVFTGTISVTDPDEVIAFSSLDGPTGFSCQTTVNSNKSVSISCPIGQLRAGEPFPTFAVFFKAPVKDTVSPMPDGDLLNCGNTDCVTFAGTTFYAEGTGGVPQSPPDNSTESWTTGAVALGTANLTLVKSAMPKSGLTVFTGVAAIPAPLSATTYPFASKVTVPSAPIYSTATIQLSDPVSCGGYANFTACYTSDVTIPGLSFRPTEQKFLRVLLRIDSSLVNNPFRVANVQVLYTPDPLTQAPAQIFACQAGQPNDTTPHCIANLFRYSNAGPNGELRGDVEVEVLGLKNGRFGIQ